MPQVTVLLDNMLAERLAREAATRDLSVEQLIPKLLRESLRLNEPPPIPPPPIDLLELWRMSPEELIALLESSDLEVQAQVKEHLSTRGKSVFDMLEKTLTHPREHVALTAAELLAASGSNLAIRPLVVAYASAKDPLKHELRRWLYRLLGRFSSLPTSAHKAINVCTPVTAPLVSRMLKETYKFYIGSSDVFSTEPPYAPEDILSLVTLLKWQRTGSMAQHIAHALTRAALFAPCLELRRALPLLRPTWRHPLVPAEFAQAAKAIEAATVTWKDLPLPAESDDEPEARNLPLPVDTESVE